MGDLGGIEDNRPDGLQRCQGEAHRDPARRYLHRFRGWNSECWRSESPCVPFGEVQTIH